MANDNDNANNSANNSANDGAGGPAPGAAPSGTSRSDDDARSDNERDTRALRKNALFNLVAYVPRVVPPVLLVFTTRAYGSDRYGVYATFIAAVWIVMRLAMTGFDRAMNWWIPLAENRDGQLTGVRAALARVLLASAAASAGLVALAGPIGSLYDMARPGDLATLRLMAASIAPLTACEFFLQACVARRTVRPMVLVREILNPITFYGAALALAALGVQATGLGWAFLLSNLIGAGAAYGAFRSVFRGDHLPRGPLPRELRRYAYPMGLSDLSLTAMTRLDKLVLGLFAPSAVVGVYDVVKQIGNTVGSLVVMFGSIVTSIVSEISTGGADLNEGNRQRVAEAFSYATAMVLFVQVPIAAAVVLFGEWLLPLFGGDFAGGELGMQLACLFWVATSSMALAGQVVNGLGGSAATMRATLVALVVEIALLVVLTPRFGLEGAVVAFGAALLTQAGIFTVQMRRLAGTWGYTRTMRVTGAAVAAAVMVVWAGPAVLASAPLWLARAAPFGLAMAALAAAAATVLRRRPTS